MASYCFLFNSRSGLPSFSKENLIASLLKLKSSSRPSQTLSCIRTSRLRSLTGITRILLFKTDFPRVLRFPVPLDKGNEGSRDEIGEPFTLGSETAQCGLEIIFKLPKKHNVSKFFLIRIW